MQEGQEGKYLSDGRVDTPSGDRNKLRPGSEDRW